MNGHCPHCGLAFAKTSGWPRTCDRCAQTTYVNPKPVAVVLVPIFSGGVLAVRRSIPPHSGSLALPGGFIEAGESWQEACVRELREETGLAVGVHDIFLHDVASTPNGQHLLVFGGCRAVISANELSSFTPNPEVLGLEIVRSAETELAFPLHTAAFRRFLSEPY